MDKDRILEAFDSLLSHSEMIGLEQHLVKTELTYDELVSSLGVQRYTELGLKSKRQLMWSALADWLQWEAWNGRI